MNENDLSKKKKFIVDDKIVVNGNKGRIIFGPFEKGFFSFYEVEFDNGTVEQVNGKHIKRQ